MALMDILKQRKQQRPTPTAAGDIRNLQQARATGKVGGPQGGPAVSGVQSQLAAQQGQAQQAQIGMQSAMQQQALGRQEQAQQQQFQLGRQQQQQQLQATQQGIADEFAMQQQRAQAQEEMAAAQMKAAETRNTQQITNSYANALSELASQRNITEQDIFANAKQMRQELGAQKTQAYLEQMAHAAAMSDQEYVDYIRRIGAERDLKDQISFRKEAMSVAFGKDMEILGEQFDMQRLINQDKRDYQKAIAQIDISTALNMAQQAAKEQAYKNIITGVTTGAQAAASYYGSSSSAPRANDYYTGAPAANTGTSVNPSAAGPMQPTQTI